jgi:hypothetical protein
MTDIADAYEGLRASDHVVSFYRSGYLDISQQDRDIAEYAYKRGAASLVDFFGRRTQLSRHPARLPPSPSCLPNRSEAGARARGREKLAVI